VGPAGGFGEGDRWGVGSQVDDLEAGAAQDVGQNGAGQGMRFTGYRSDQHRPRFATPASE
jgi:hypothetical protein